MKGLLVKHPISAHRELCMAIPHVSLAIGLAAVLAFAGPARSNAQEKGTKEAAAPAPKRDISGVWLYQGSGGQESTAPEKDFPPMTPWAKARFDAERPGYGSRATPEGNDPILQCDPSGFPRVMFFPTPFEFVQTPAKVIQFFEREHAWRPIWTDGRSLPKDPDPTWYGYAVGHWEGDYTLVIESAGFNDKTWLGATGYPHSEVMRVTERYQRVDRNTIAYNIRVDDPKAYTKPIIAPQRIMKLRPGVELSELPCVWSEENSFTKRIREPAVRKP
jgi:hypothetical protein